MQLDHLNMLAAFLTIAGRAKLSRRRNGC